MEPRNRGGLFLMLLVGVIVGVIAARLASRSLATIGLDDSHSVDWNLDLMQSAPNLRVCAYTSWLQRHSCKVNLRIYNGSANDVIHIRAKHKGMEADRLFQEFDVFGNIVVDLDGAGKAEVSLTVNRDGLYGGSDGKWAYYVGVPRDQPEIIIEN